MKYYIIAGEASGDLHGGNLVREIRRRDPAAEIRCWGGDHMEAAGGVLVKHYRDLAFMGFLEVVAHLRTILRNMRFCREDIVRFRPDVVVFIDYPGFNIPMATFAKRKGLRTVYYISPQVWAWKEGRVRTLKKVVDHMLVILPFEKDFYRRWDWEVQYVGHPLVGEIERRRASAAGDAGDQPHAGSDAGVELRGYVDGRPTVAMLPGSRRQEVRLKLPVMLQVAERFPQCRFVVAQAPGLDDAFLASFLSGRKGVEVRKGDTYGLLLEADAALVTSGTATLETALFGVPQVVCYKGNPLSYRIAKRLVKIRYISLVNLIMDREVVRELIQDDLTPDNLARELATILDPGVSARVRSDYTELQALLSRGGDASARAADCIVETASGG
jgi:lipid-A-disaccharide synthase